MAEEVMQAVSPEDVKTERIDDFTDLYANNTQYESSIWDLKMIFGQLDQSRKPPVIQQHTSVALSWPQAKISAYYLMVNFLIHEHLNGVIGTPSSIIPPRPDVNDPTLDESGKKTIAKLAWIHDQLFSGKPFVAPISEDPK